MVFWGGTPDDWGFHEYHSEFMDVLESAWGKCKAKLTGHHLRHENRITNELVKEARKHPTVVDCVFR